MVDIPITDRITNLCMRITNLSVHCAQKNTSWPRQSTLIQLFIIKHSSEYVIQYSIYLTFKHNITFCIFPFLLYFPFIACVCSCELSLSRLLFICHLYIVCINSHRLLQPKYQNRYQIVSDSLKMLWKTTINQHRSQVICV